MKTLQWHNVLSLAVKQAGKWAVYVRNRLDNTPEDNKVWDDIRKAFEDMYGSSRTKENNFSSDVDQAMLSMLLNGLVLFDTEDEMWKFYSVFERTLVDSSAVYACAFSPDGECLTENT
jgi:hypothetical protein